MDSSLVVTTGKEEQGELEGVKRMVTEGDLTLDGEHAM